MSGGRYLFYSGSLLPCFLPTVTSSPGGRVESTGCRNGTVSTVALGPESCAEVPLLVCWQVPVRGATGEPSAPACLQVQYIVLDAGGDDAHFGNIFRRYTHFRERAREVFHNRVEVLLGEAEVSVGHPHILA